MSFWSDIVDSITGAFNNLTGTTQATQVTSSQQNQYNLQQQYLADQQALALAQLNPDLAKERTKQIIYVTIGVIVISIAIIIYYKNK